MGNLQAATFAWRLTVEGAEAVSKAFDNVGKAANKNMKDTATSSNTASSALLGVTKQLGSMQKQGAELEKLRRQIVLIAGVSGLGLLVDKSLSAAVEIKKLSAETGFAVEGYQEIVFALKQFNVEQGTASAAMRKFSQETANFVEHNAGPAKEGLRALFGADAQDVAQQGLQNVDKFFIEVLNRIGKLSNEAQKLNLLRQIFGKDAGPQLIEAANEGSRAIEEQIALAQELGLVFSKDMVESADQAQDKITLLSDILRTKLQMSIVESADSMAYFAQVATDNLPTVLKIMEKISSVAGGIAANLRDAYAAVGVGLYDVYKVGEAALFKRQNLHTGADGVMGDLINPLDAFGGNTGFGGTAPDGGMHLTVRNTKKPGGYVPKGDDERLKNTKALSNAYEKLVFNLKEEIDAIGMSAREQAISNEVRKLGASVTDEQRDAIEKLAGQLYDEKEAWDNINDAAKDAANTIGDGLKDALMHADNLQDGLRGVGLELLDIAYKALIGDSASSGLGSLITGALGSLTGGMMGGGSGGMSTVGGSVWGEYAHIPSFDVGTDYVPHDMIAQIHKGEKITPASQNRAGGDGVRVVVEDHAGVSVSASRRSDGAIALRLTRLEEGMDGLNRSIEPRAVTAVQQARMRSTNF